MSIIPTDLSMSVLSIGTAVLARDVMDQHLRTLGDIRTYYASNLTFALQTYSERSLDIIFCELTFPGGSAEEFVRKIGGLDVTDNLFFVLTSSQDARHTNALAAEINADSVLMSPFTTNDILVRIEAAVKKKTRDRGLWLDQLLEAKQAAKNKRGQEAKAIFEELLKNNPENEDVLLSAAQFYMQVPEPAAAGDCLTKIISINPQNVRAKSLFATLSLKNGNFEDSLSIFNSLQKDSPLNTTRVNEIAQAHILMALKLSRSALDVSDSNALAILNSIKFLTVLGNYPEALNTYMRFRDHLLGEEKKQAEFYVALSKKLGNIA